LLLVKEVDTKWKSYIIALNKMKFKDLIRKNSWSSIEIRLLDFFPKEKSRISAYEEVFLKLQIMQEKESNMLIVLDKEYDSDAPNGYYVGVSGRKKDNTKDEPKMTPLYAIEFTPWDEWLSMEIDSNTISEFTEHDIIAHCLYEMTFIGFDEMKIQGKLNQLTKTAEAVENMTEEEKAKLITIDKLIFALDEKLYKIRRAQDGDEAYLTEISFISKKYLDYPPEYFTIRKSEQTITKEYLSKNEVFVCEKDKKIIAFYSIVNIIEPFRIGEIKIEKSFWLEHMFVNPENIGEEIGEKLFYHLIDFCKEHLINGVRILADLNSKGFFQKMGCDYIKEYPSTIQDRTTSLMIYRL
jgi:N-acetylglutamate synthase-like GNAT family acetyltransferase